MEKKFTLLIVLLFTMINTIFAQKYVEYYFKVPFQNNKMLNELNEICSVDKFDDQFVYAYANPKQFAQVTLSYPNFKILTNPSLEFPIEVAQSKSEMREWDTYPSYSTYITMMNDFATDYPDLCTVESIGTSVDNREILVAKISDNALIEEAEPKFFYSGQMHGDEIVCSILFLRLIDYLLENYGLDQEITDIVNNTQIYINPLSNPDGLYTDNDNTINGATRYNANGVDLNRNFPVPVGNQHPDDNVWQPENIAMMDFASQHNFVMSSNSHSGAVVVNYPWDTWSRTHPDDDWFQYVSRIYADTVQENAPSPYMTDFEDGITNGYQWYQTYGNRQDWFTYDRNCREITIELSFNKTVPANQLNAHWDYNYQSMIKWLKQVNYGIQGSVTNELGNPVIAKVEILNHDLEQDNSFVYSSSIHGDFYRLISAGVYDVKISAEGYESQVIENVTVENNANTFLYIVLENSVLTSLEGYVYDVDANPIDDATIVLSDLTTYEVNSNESGYFQFPELYTGSYNLTVSASGYQSIFQNINVTADSQPLSFQLAESNAISFETELSEEWFSTSQQAWARSNSEAYDGNYSLKSASIGNESYSNIQLELFSQQSMISFYYKVSSESGYDFLSFFVNDVQMGLWSGEIDWTYVEFPVQAGVNTFKWVYEKDFSYQEGSDCAWIDFVQLPTSTDNEINEDVSEIINTLTCYPNPFNPEVNIRFFQNKSNPIPNISIYNIKGQKVNVIENLPSEQGLHTVVWNGKDLDTKKVSSGIYFVIADNGINKQTRKIVLMK